MNIIINNKKGNIVKVTNPKRIAKIILKFHKKILNNESFLIGDYPDGTGGKMVERKLLRVINLPKTKTHRTVK